MFMNPIQGPPNRDLERRRAAEPWWYGPLLYLLTVAVVSGAFIGGASALYWFVVWLVS